MGCTMPNVCSPQRAPRYRLHKRTSQAVVTIDGNDIYLGKHGSAARLPRSKQSPILAP